MNWAAMDDLDHSVHIAERDWDIFFEESEECSLAQPELAGIEDSGLSDDDDPANPAPEGATPMCAEHVCLGCSTVPTVNHEEEEGVETTVTQFQPDTLTCQQESCVSLTEETQTQLSHPVPVAAEVPKDAEDVNEEDSQEDSTQSPQTQCEAEQHGAEADFQVAESVPLAERKEKERWFVTVNDSPVQLRYRPCTASQKKRRKKKTSRMSAHIVAGWGRHLSQSETETETERCEESKSDLTEMTETSCTTVSQLPKNIALSENICAMPQGQALNLTTSNLPHQETLCKRQKENDCRSTISNVDHFNQNEQPSTQLPQTFSASGNPPSIPTCRLPSETQKSSLPHTDQHVAEKSCHTCPMILLNETTSSDSGKTEKNPQGIPCKENSLDPSNNHDTLHQRLATFNTDGDEAPSPPPEESESKGCVSEESLAEALDPAHRVFAISSFWDEMEKLTINDILHLRFANTQYPSTDAFHLHETTSLPDSHDSSPLDPADICDQDTVPLDALDNADSDYFTHLDDSKPDRSSCEFSTFSDFDEDLLQMINNSPSASPEPEIMGELPQTQTPTQRFSELAYPQAALTEQEMELVRHAKPELEFTQLYFDTGIPLLLCSDADSSSQTLSPAGSEYDMAALDSEIVREACFTSALQDEGVNTMLIFPFEKTQDTSLLLADCNIVKETPSPILPTSSFLEDSLLISFNDMFETCEDAPHASLFDRPSSEVSLQIHSENLSVPESYDYFFSDFDEGNLFFPLKHEIKDRAGKTVPIFSCSRSLVRDLTFPEVEQFIESEEEDNWGPVRVISRFSHQQGSGSSASAAPDVYLYSGRSWKSMLSLRRFRFAGMRNSWCQRAKAWVSPGSLFQTIQRSSSIADMTRGACSSLQVFHLGDPVLRKLALEHTRLPDRPYALSKCTKG